MAHHIPDLLLVETRVTLVSRNTVITVELLYGVPCARNARWLAVTGGKERLLEEAASAGVTLAVASSTARENIDTLLGAHFGAGAAQRFSVIGAGDAVPQKKPAPDIYRFVLARAGRIGRRLRRRRGFGRAGGRSIRIIAPPCATPRFPSPRFSRRPITACAASCP
jgi:hypothetical protein